MEEWQFKAAPFGSTSCTPTLSNQGDDLVTSWKYVWVLCFGFFFFSLSLFYFFSLYGCINSSKCFLKFFNSRHASCKSHGKVDLHLVSVLPEDMVSFVGDHRHENLCRGGSVWRVRI